MGLADEDEKCFLRGYEVDLWSQTWELVSTPAASAAAVGSRAIVSSVASTPIQDELMLELDASSLLLPPALLVLVLLLLLMLPGARRKRSPLREEVGELLDRLTTLALYESV